MFALKRHQPAITFQILNDDVIARRGGVQERRPSSRGYGSLNAAQAVSKGFTSAPNRLAPDLTSCFRRPAAGNPAPVGQPRPSAVERRLPAVGSSIAKVRATVMDFATAYCDADAELLSDIALCVSEAAANVVAHAYADSSGELSLTV